MLHQTLMYAYKFLFTNHKYIVKAHKMKIEDLLSALGQSGTINIQTLNLVVSGDEGGGSSSAPKDVVNPGIEYQRNGRAKWSPPLQQQLSVMKGAVGTTTDDPTIQPDPEERDDIVSARNDTGSDSNSAVEKVLTDIDAQEQHETETEIGAPSTETPPGDDLTRLKELIGTLVAKNQQAMQPKKTYPTDDNPPKMFIRNFPS